MAVVAAAMPRRRANPGDMPRHAQRQGHDRQCRVLTAGRREDRSVRDENVVEAVHESVRAGDARLGVSAHAHPAHDVRAVRDGGAGSLGTVGVAGVVGDSFTDVDLVLEAG